MNTLHWPSVCYQKAESVYSVHRPKGKKWEAAPNILFIGTHHKYAPRFQWWTQAPEEIKSNRLGYGSKTT